MQRGIRNTRRMVWVAAAIFIIISALVFWSLAARRPRVNFGDGLSLEWVGITEGTNALSDGSLVEQLLGDLIPAQGWELSSLKVRRPTALRSYEEDAPLTAWIRLKGPALQRNNRNYFGYYWDGSRAATANDSGRQIEIPPPRPFGGRSTNETIIYIPIYAFPRDEKKVRLKILPPRDVRGESRWAEFEFENPFYGKFSRLKASPLPITNVIGEHEFILREVRTNPTEMVFIMPTTNWYGAESYISDEEGNRTARMGRRTRSKGREQTVELKYSLEPNRTWKISATFVGASLNASMGSADVDESEFPAAQQFLLSLSVGSEAWLTNTIGTTYRCRFDGETVSIGKPGARELPYFIVLGATNRADQKVGRRLQPMAGSALSWRSSGPERVQIWRLGQTCTNLMLHLALPTVVTTEFYVRPDEPKR